MNVSGTVQSLMQTIRARLSLNTLLVLILGMSLATALAWQAVSNLYINTQRDNLLAQAKLIAAALDGSTAPHQPPTLFANIQRRAWDSHAPVDGKRRGRGRTAVDGLELCRCHAEQNASVPTSELIQRPEIQSALQGTPATALRQVLGNQRVLYAAAPIQR